MKLKIYKSSFMLTVVLIMALALAGTAVADDSEPGTAPIVAVTSDVSIASLAMAYQIQGNVSYSADGLGQNTPGGLIQADVPAGSTVVKAFLYGSYYFTANPNLGERTIDFDGTLVVTTQIATVSNFLSTTRADVTAQVAAKVGSGGGITNFAINNDTSQLNGIGLVVVYTNPLLPLGTVAILDGGASQTGDTFFFNLAAPLDKTIPGFSAIMSLGSGHSYQGGSGFGTHVCGGGQFSIIDINSTRLSTCAGNYDDGFAANGALITVGGVGDNILNPPNPFGAGGEDDELYNIEPFLSQGDTVIQINSSNPSQDDSLFLSVIKITALAVVSAENCSDGIDNDLDGLIDGADPDCIPANQPPGANAGGPYSGNEGSAISLDGTGSSDPDGDPLTYSWSVDSALCSFDDASSATPNLTCTDDGNYNVTLTVDDGLATDSDTAVVTVSNVAPTVSIDSVSPTLLAVGGYVTANGSFTDPGTSDTHTAQWDWGDGTSAGTVTQGAGSGSVSDNHTYYTPGIYTVGLTVSDDDTGAGTTTFEFVVVYDPNGGFVTGGGWIDSPAGAYKPDVNLSGKATFGFVSKYKKGATVPEGNTEFQFHAAGMNFHSDTYQWLVVTGSNYAMFKGVGTINGGLDPNGNAFKFMLWAGDGSSDTFRIRIWWEDTDSTEYDVYDNGVDQVINGGSIVIHTKK